MQSDNATEPYGHREGLAAGRRAAPGRRRRQARLAADHDRLHGRDVQLGAHIGASGERDDVAALRVGFGRIVASEIEDSIICANMVYSG